MAKLFWCATQYLRFGRDCRLTKKKPKYVRNRVDCSLIENRNPTRLLQAASHDLKDIEDLDLLKEKMTKIMEDSEISRKNLFKFRKARDGIDTLAEMQKYLYNFILAGSAMQTRFDDK